MFGIKFQGLNWAAEGFLGAIRVSVWGSENGRNKNKSNYQPLKKIAVGVPESFVKLLLFHLRAVQVLEVNCFWIIKIATLLLIIGGWYYLYIEVSFANLSKNGIGAKRGGTDFVGWVIQHQFDAFRVVLQVPKRTSGHSSWS